MALNDLITPDVFVHVPPSLTYSRNKNNNDKTSANSTAHRPAKEDVRVLFLLPGNPGLVGYYHGFLTQLLSSASSAASYSSVSSSPTVGIGIGTSTDTGTGTSTDTGTIADKHIVVGMSLPGFEAADDELSEEEMDLLWPDGVAGLRSRKSREAEAAEGRKGVVWGVEEIVRVGVARVGQVVRRVQDMRRRVDGGGGKGKKVKVTLVGHSLGSWLALEMVRVLNELQEKEWEGAEPGVDESGVLGVGRRADEREVWERPRAGDGGGVVGWEVEACVLLAPTIVELAKSSQGRKAAPLLRCVPGVGGWMQGVAGWLGWGVSEEAQRSMVAWFMGLDRGSDGVVTTTRWLRSENGVRQSLELAKEEMVCIAKDEWGVEVWGAGEALQMGGLDEYESGPKVYMLFAERDHWIADKTREKILRTRARREGRGRLVVDDRGLSHAWCLRQNQLVVDYVTPWLEEIVKGK